MLRNGLSALTGVIAAVMLMMVIQKVALAAFPPSKEIFEANRKIYDADPAVVEQARDIFARELPKHPLQLVLIIVSHALGTFFGAFTAVRISREAQLVPASIVAGLMLLGGICNVILIPHPVWFNIIDLLLYIPAALLAWKLTTSEATDAAIDPAPPDDDPTTTATTTTVEP